MDSTNSIQTNAKTFLRTLTMIYVLSLVLSMPLSSADAVPQDPKFGDECRDNEITLTVTCCWYETDEGDTIVCQTCDIDIETGDISKEDCKPAKTMPFEPSTSDYRPPLVSDRGPMKEQMGNQELQETPTFNTRNQEKVSPSEEGLTNQELQQDTLSGEETEQTSEEGNSDDLGSTFAKKGNTQNSPVPPECPKQGPIPPDCTMKPKF